VVINNVDFRNGSDCGLSRVLIHLAVNLGYLHTCSFLNVPRKIVALKVLSIHASLRHCIHFLCYVQNTQLLEEKIKGFKIVLSAS